MIMHRLQNRTLVSSSTTVNTLNPDNKNIDFMGAVYYPYNGPKPKHPPIQNPREVRGPFCTNIPFLGYGRCFLDSFMVVSSDSSLAGLGLLKIEYIERDTGYFWWKRPNLHHSSRTGISTLSAYCFVVVGTACYPREVFPEPTSNVLTGAWCRSEYMASVNFVNRKEPHVTKNIVGFFKKNAISIKERLNRRSCLILLKGVMLSCLEVGVGAGHLAHFGDTDLGIVMGLSCLALYITTIHAKAGEGAPEQVKDEVARETEPKPLPNPQPIRDPQGYSKDPSVQLVARWCFASRLRCRV